MPKKWSTTKEACEHLRRNRNLLQQQRENGIIPKHCWKTKNPNAKRLTYLYDLSAIDQLEEEVIQAPSMKAKLLGTQSSFVKGVKPYDITVDGEAVPSN